MEQVKAEFAEKKKSVVRKKVHDMKASSKWYVSVKGSIYDIAGSLLQALGVWCFIEPCHIAPGRSIRYGIDA